MSTNLQFDGFYASGPIDWVDWHAGVRMHGTYFEFIRFYPNGDWVSCVREFNSFLFWNFTETMSQELWGLAKQDRVPKHRDSDRACQAGTYVLNCNMLTTTSESYLHAGSPFVNTWRIAEDRIEIQYGETQHVFLFYPVC